MKSSIWNRSTEGINVEKDESEEDDKATDVNHTSKAAIELLVVGGSTVSCQARVLLMKMR